jgi:hypothetical protein
MDMKHKGLIARKGNLARGSESALDDALLEGNKGSVKSQKAMREFASSLSLLAALATRT